MPFHGKYILGDSRTLINIGIDARTMSGFITGIGRYTLQISKKLCGHSNTRLSFYLPSCPEERILDSLCTANLKISTFDGRFTKMIWSQTRLPYQASKDQIDLFWGPTHRLPRFLPKPIAKVVTIHDLVWKYAPQTMRPLSLFVEKRLMPEAIGMADLVMADSHSTASGIAEFFPQYAHKVRVVHLGVSSLASTLNAKTLLQFNISKPYFLFVGTIEPRKNLDRLLKAFALVPESLRKHFSLVIAGGKGWGDVNLEKFIREYELKDSVKLLGYVTDQELAALYSHARFLVMPSIYEGFGLPLLEAMQYGTPVLTSHDGSMAEVAGDSGILIDPFSVESISAGIQEMLADDNLVKTLGNNARRRAQDFSWDKCATETMEVFKEAIVLRDIRMSRS
jgi:glycosyltransferase involved in cell wall biosynthesis